MIKLRTAAYSHLSAPPTHAKLIHLRHTDLPEDLDLSRHAIGWSAMMPRQTQMDVVYVLGEISSDRFVVNQHLSPVHAMVDFTDYSDVEQPPANAGPDRAGAYENLQQRTAAARNLVAADKTPTPGAPFTARPAPGKPAGEYRDLDVDALVAFFDERLCGEVVPDDPT